MQVTIENICSDFFIFWEQAQDRSFDDQVQLWHTEYEEKHQDLFKSYYEDFPQAKFSERVEQAFELFDKVAPHLKELNQLIEPMIKRAITYSASLLDVSNSILHYVVMIGLFIADGWSTEAYQGRRTSFVALDYIAGKYNSSEPRYLEILLTHETVHSHHYQCNASTWREYHIGEALFLEGFAVLVSSKALPGATEAEYLWFNPGYEAWFKTCERQWFEIQQHLLEDFDATDSERYAAYFQLFGKSQLPLRSGYFAGYRLVSTLNQQYSLREMARWNLLDAAEKIRYVLQTA